MRKADYTFLASNIAGKRFAAQHNESACTKANDPGHALYWQGVGKSLELLARDFAASASVDRAEFLKACGID